MTKRIIAVVGATGAQGGGLVRAILADRTGDFAVRAITRNTASDKARELAALGAEVIGADIDDEASMAAALQGAYGAYFVTFYWAHFSPQRETDEAHRLARAAKAARLRHVVWSTLEDTRNWVPLEDQRMPTLMGRYKVPHFDAKGESNRFFSALGVPTTFLLTSFYWDNFINLGMGPRREPDGRLAFTLPMDDERLPGIGSEDIGRCAYGIFRKGTELIGQTIGIAGEHLTGQELADAFSVALAEAVSLSPCSPQQYRALGFPGAEDLGNMFQFKRDFAQYYCAARSVAVSRALNPQLQSFATWLERHKDRLPAP